MGTHTIFSLCLTNFAGLSKINGDRHPFPQTKHPQDRLIPNPAPPAPGAPGTPLPEILAKQGARLDLSRQGRGSAAVRSGPLTRQVQSGRIPAWFSRRGLAARAGLLDGICPVAGYCGTDQTSPDPVDRNKARAAHGSWSRFLETGACPACVERRLTRLSGPTGDRDLWCLSRGKPGFGRCRASSPGIAVKRESSPGRVAEVHVPLCRGAEGPESGPKSDETRLCRPIQSAPTPSAL